ncbi:MAG: hypothetical protein WBN09_11785 [Woeseiaceae bacterium]
MNRIALLLITFMLSACGSDQQSIDEIATHRASQVLVNQKVDEEFLNAVGKCHLYDKYNYHQIGDANADAFADTGRRHFQMVLVADSFDSFVVQYDDRTMTCVGELPPFSTIWILSPDEECGLVEDHSDRAREYGLSYSSVVMEKLIAERECN